MPSPTERHALPYAAPLMRILDEAEDIARATDQRPSTAHLLLSFFTSRNQAERLLRDRQIDEDRLLELVDPANKEPKQSIREVLERAAQVAAGCGAREVDTLHVLVAMTRARDSMAYQLLERTGEKLPLLRNRALTILTGAVPRWLTGKEAAELQEPAAAVQVSSMLPTKARSSVLQAAPRRELPPRDKPKGPPITWTPPILLSETRPQKRPSVPPAEAKRRQKELARREEKENSRLSGGETQRLEGVRAKTQLAPAPLSEPPATSPRPAHGGPARPAQDPATPWLLSPDEYPWLTSIGRNLSADAARGQLDPLVGREREVESLIDILGKRRANNPVLIGEPGVGKTAVVEGLASRLVHQAPTEALGKKIVIGLDVGSLLVGTHLRGSFNEKLLGLREEVQRSGGRVIVFFDELHTLVGAGSTGDGPQDAANELKTALARGDFPCIGATTPDEYTQHIEPDAALKRRFVPVLIKEPSQDEAVKMLARIVPEYANHHGVRYADEALKASVVLSARYLTDRHLPDKAIALLDLAGSRAARAGLRAVDARLVAELVAQRVDLPVERLLGSDEERLLGLEDLLKKEVIGHERQLQRIAQVVRRNAAGFHSQRPQGAFLFVGPTGVGKTETAKALAKLLHGSSDSLIRFDLSEFAEAHAVARLVGAPPGYVGYDAGGQLTEAVRKRPGRVILFDEIEKAHRDVLQLLLQILDEGRLTDGHGRTVSFAETIVILTSNLGADLARARKIGFQEPAGASADLEREILARAKEALSPELWGRIEDKLVFQPLSRPEVRSIARLLAADSSKRLYAERGIAYELDDSAVEYLLDQGGYDLALGARPMRQALARIVEGPIAARILEGRLYADERVLVSTRAGGALVFLVGEDRTSLSQRPVTR